MINSLNNIATVKTGVTVAFLLAMALFIYFFFVATHIVVVKEIELVEKNENIYTGETGKVFLPVMENHKNPVVELTVDKVHSAAYIENGECYDYPVPFNTNCVKTAAVKGVNGELEEINALKDLLYSDIEIKERIGAIKKLGKYRNKVSYDILLHVPFESDSEVRLEILKQLHHLLPQLVKEYGESIRYTFELAMSDMDESVALLAEDALKKFDDLNANLPENNEVDNSTYIGDNFPY